MVKDGKVTSSAGILKRDVGRNISTKAVGSFEIEDVTDEYKYKEGIYLSSYSIQDCDESVSCSVGKSIRGWPQRIKISLYFFS